MIDRDLRVRSFEERLENKHSGVQEWIQAALMGAQLLSGLMGASSAKKAQDKQNALEAEQLAQQTALGNRQLDLATLQNKQGMAGTVDANGNHMYYDDATNTWKTDLGTDGKRQLYATNHETMEQLGPDAAASRQERTAAADRRYREGSVADTTLSQYARDQANGGKYSPSSIESALRLSRTGAVNAGYDQVSSNASLAAARAGGAAGNGAALSAMAKARAQTLAETMGTPYVEGIQTAEGLNNAASGQKLSEYNTLAGRASNVDGAPTATDTVSPAIAAAIASQKSGAASGNAQSASTIANAATGLRAANNTYNSGSADRVATAGSTGIGLSNLLGSLSGNSDIMNSLAKLGKTKTPITDAGLY